MKMKKHLSLLLCVLLLAGILAGCGSSSGSTASNRSSVYAAGDTAAVETALSGSTVLTDSGSTDTTAVPEGRKWIITMYITAETEDMDAMSAALTETIDQLEGYVESQTTYNGSAYSTRRYRYSDLTVRIPADDVDLFTQEVEGLSNVISKEKDLEDVTLSYVATESRMTALETEETRLLELLAQAENMSDLLEIEERLTDVRYELESVTSQLRLYDNQIDYATIYLTIEEVQEYTAVEEQTLWERIRDGFTGSLKGLGESVQDLLVLFIAALPYLVVYGGIALVIVLLLLRACKRARAKKAAKKAAEKAPENPPDEPTA